MDMRRRMKRPRFQHQRTIRLWRVCSLILSYPLHPHLHSLPIRPLHPPLLLHNRRIPPRLSSLSTTTKMATAMKMTQSSQLRSVGGSRNPRLFDGPTVLPMLSLLLPSDLLVRYPPRSLHPFLLYTT